MVRQAEGTAKIKLKGTTTELYSVALLTTVALSTRCKLLSMSCSVGKNNVKNQWSTLCVYPAPPL